VWLVKPAIAVATNKTRAHRDRPARLDPTALMENMDPTAPREKPDRKATKAFHRRRHHHRIATLARKETKDPPDRLAPLDPLDQKVNPAPKDRTASPAAPAAAVLVNPVRLAPTATLDRKATPVKMPRLAPKALLDPKDKMEAPARLAPTETKEPTENPVVPDQQAHPDQPETPVPTARRDRPATPEPVVNPVQMPSIALARVVPKSTKSVEHPIPSGYDFLIRFAILLFSATQKKT
jgi:hypothetical protein